MKESKPGFNTICTHAGGVEDSQFRGATSPLYMSTSYAYEEVDKKRYPRYFNTPNQDGLSKKIALLEHCDSALIFGSGMAAISTAMLSFLRQGDHVIIQQSIYGGAYNFMVKLLPKYGIDYNFTDGFTEKDFRAKLKPTTKVIYIETPSNPLMKITNLEMIAKIADENNLVSMIDNTFASPVNQNPADFGIDIIIHSATKYMGGHSDICAGAVAAKKEYIDQIWSHAIQLGGNLSEYTVWLLERSIKTMGIRVERQNSNAKKMARWLEKNKFVKRVFYPGLKSNPDHKIAKKQMKGFSGMLSFELSESVDTDRFVKALKLIRPSMSLAGLESIILSPAKTSHALLGPEERKRQGISESLLRLSVGVEEVDDLKEDLKQAFLSASNK